MRPSEPIVTDSGLSRDIERTGQRRIGMYRPTPRVELRATAGTVVTRVQAECFAEEQQWADVVPATPSHRRLHVAFAFGSRFADQHVWMSDPGGEQPRVARLK